MIRQLPGGGPPRRRSDIATRRYVEAQLKRPGTGGGGSPPTGQAGGDLAGTYPNPSLAAILAAGGPTGGPTTVPVITWDAKGRLTVVSTATIVGPFPPNGAAGGDLTGSYPNPTLTAILAAGGPTGSATVVPVLTWDAKGRLTAVSTATIVGPFPPNGAAGGDLAGTYPNPTVAKINGVAYSADPLVQYTKLAGRTGTTNDTKLSLDAIGSLYGSHVVGAGGTVGKLRLYANDQATVGRYYLYDNYVELPNHPLRILTNPTQTYAGVFIGYTLGAGPTVGTTMNLGADVGATRNSPAFYPFPIDDGLTVNWQADTGLEAAIHYGYAHVFKNDPSANRTLGWVFGLGHGIVIKADTKILTMSTLVGAAWNNPTFSVLSGGTGTVAEVTGLYSSGNLNTGWTATLWNGLHVAAPGGTGGTGTTLAGVIIEDLAADARFTNAYSLWSKGLATKMLHAGPVRIGDTATPSLSLEVISASATAAVAKLDRSTVVTGTNVPVLDLLPGGVAIGSGGSFRGVSCTGTITLNANPNVFGVGNFFTYQALLKTATSTAISCASPVTFAAVGTYQGDNAALTLTSGLAASQIGFWHSPAFNIVGTGTGTAVSVIGLLSSGSVTSGWTITNWLGTNSVDPGGTGGTITNQIAHDVAALSRGSTLIAALRSAIAHGTGKWFLLDTAGADSAFVGGLRLGDNTVPNFKLDVRGGAGFGQRTVTNSNATIANTDFLVSMSTGNTNQTATLPAAAPGNTGMVVTIVKTDAGTGTVTVSTVVGGNKVITANQGRGAVFQSDGAGWYMVAGNL